VLCGTRRRSLPRQHRLEHFVQPPFDLAQEMSGQMGLGDNASCPGHDPAAVGEVSDRLRANQLEQAKDLLLPRIGRELEYRLRSRSRQLLIAGTVDVGGSSGGGAQPRSSASSPKYSMTSSLPRKKWATIRPQSASSIAPSTRNSFR
jgi:hypothetical protein